MPVLILNRESEVTKRTAIR